MRDAISEMFGMREPRDGQWLGVSERDYHADPCDQPSLSASVAKMLLNESPAHAYAYHPKLGGHRREDKASYGPGNIIHAILLGTVEESLRVLSPDDFRKADGTMGEEGFGTKRARAAKALAEAEGKTALTPSQFAGYQQIADRLRAKLADRGVALDGRTEQTVVWTELADDGTEVQCRGRLDHYARGVIDDLKTGLAVDPRKLARNAIDLGHDIQAAAYTRAIQAIIPDLAGRIEYRWICVELVEPHCVTLARPAGSMLSMGLRRWRRAVNLWARCLRDGHWPEFDGGIEIYVEPPPWALANEMASIDTDDEEAAE